MRAARGYTLLAILLILAGATALVLAVQWMGGDERRRSAEVRNEQQALFIAEAGLTRVQAYLSEVLAQDGDFDRALDPNLDDDCTQLPTLGGGLSDDNLPPFAGTVVPFGAAGQPFLEVAYGGGAYLIRIDDDADDALQLADLSSTNNHLQGPLACREGPSVGVENPVRDRNRTVVATVVGLYPGTHADPQVAQKGLRAIVAPPAPIPGIITGGDVSFSGQAVTGAFASASVQGNAALPAMPPGTAIAATGACAPQASCVSEARALPAPVIDPWDRTNAPLPCDTTTGSCPPFYYAQAQGGMLLVWRWNYWAAGCPNPRGFGRLCYAGSGPPDPLVSPTGTSCSSCWQPVGAWSQATGIRMQDVGADTPTPQFDGGPNGNQVWVGAPATPAVVSSGCSADIDVYPGGRISNTTLMSEDFLPGSGTLPHGTWMLEGNLRLNSTLGSCTTSASVLVLGDAISTTGQALALTPAAPKGYVVLAGRDLLLGGLGVTGGSLSSCASGGSVLVHEQVSMTGLISAQIAVEDAPSCSGTVGGTLAIGAPGGGAHIDVSSPPTYYSGPLAYIRSRSE